MQGLGSSGCPSPHRLGRTLFLCGRQKKGGGLWASVRMPTFPTSVQDLLNRRTYLASSCCTRPLEFVRNVLRARLNARSTSNNFFSVESASVSIISNLLTLRSPRCCGSQRGGYIGGFGQACKLIEGVLRNPCRALFGRLAKPSRSNIYSRSL